jgi:hypothetical protein
LGGACPDNERKFSSHGFGLKVLVNVTESILGHALRKKLIVIFVFQKLNIISFMAEKILLGAAC